MPRSNSQEIARQLFLRLVTLGEGTEDTRRRALQSELYSLGGDEMQAVIRAFDESRLLTFDRDPLTREPTVELAHEAIIREWGQLRTWLDESRDDVRQQRLLGAAANEWLKNGGDSSYLLTGARLTQFEDWYGQTSLALTEDEHAYLHASFEERQRQGILEDERQERELRLAHEARVAAEEAAAAQKQAANRLRYAVAVFLIAAMVGLGLAIFAFVQRNQTQRQAAVNRSLVLAANAREEHAKGFTDLALILAFDAVSMDNPPPQSIATLKEIAFGRGTEKIFELHGGKYVPEMTLTPDGSKVVSTAYRFNRDKCPSDSVSYHQCFPFEDSELVLWDSATGQTIFTLPLETNVVPDPYGGPAIAINSDGTMAAIATLKFGENGEVILWDLTTGNIVERIPTEYEYIVIAVAFSPDNRFILAGGLHADEEGVVQWERAAEVLVWDIQNHQEAQRLIGHQGAVLSMRVSADEQSVFTGSWDGTVRQWDLTTYQEIRRFELGIPFIYAIPSPDGRHLLTNSNDIQVRLWDIETQQILRTYTITTFLSDDAAFTPDGKFVFISFRDNMPIVDVATWQTIQTIRNEGIQWLEISKDGNMMMTALDGPGFRRWDLAGLTGLSPFLSNLPGTASAIDITPDGTKMIVGTLEGSLIVYDTQTREEITRIDNPAILDPLGVQITDDGRYAIASSVSYYRHADPPIANLSYWDLTTKELLYRIDRLDIPDTPESAAERLGGDPIHVTMSLDNTRVVAGTILGPYHELLLLDISNRVSPVIRHQLKYENGWGILATDITHDGAFVAGSFDFPLDVVLWNIETGQEVRHYDAQSAHTARIDAIVFTPDDKEFLTASQDGTMVLWDVETGAVIRRYIGHGDAIWTIDISPDGRYVVSGSPTKVTLWDFATAEILQQVATTAYAVMFDPSGKRVYIPGFPDGSHINAWEIRDPPLDEVLAWVQQNRYVRDITPEECLKYPLVVACDEAEQVQP